MDPVLCPRFVGRWIEGVTVGPSPDHVQMRLLAAGQRPISNVVDASNYVMVELGKPIHTFDAAAVHDGRIIVRRATAGERFVTLDHVERTLDPETLVIADPAGPIGIAGVMGGETSEVSDATTDVVVESAIFDPVNIRRTAFRYALRSEASLRFEKGQEFRMARLGADRTAPSSRTWAGGAVAPGAVDSNPAEPPPATIAFRPGAGQPAARARHWTQTNSVPSWRGSAIETAPAARGTARHDRRRRRAARRSTGGARASSKRSSRPGAATSRSKPTSPRRSSASTATSSSRRSLPHTPMPAYRHEPLELARRRPRDARRSRPDRGRHDGPRRSRGWSSASRLVTTARSPTNRSSAPPGRPITVTNPLSSQHSVLRQSLIGSLLEVVATNLRHGRDDVAIFEVGKGYGAPDGPPTHEWWRLAFALTGAAEPPAWDRASPAVRPRRREGSHRAAVPPARLPDARVRAADDDPNLHPGRAARVRAGGDVVGRVGELHPATVAALDLRADRILVAELAVAGLAAGRPATPRVFSPSRHPSVERDLAVIVAEDRRRRRRPGLDPAPWRAAPPARRALRRLPREAARRRRRRASPGA